MALGRTYSVALVGLNGYIVEVEADIGQTLPAFVILGLPDASLNEAKERIRSAAQNSGIPLSRRKITANLIPASLPKRGSGFDLAIAMAVLLAANDVRPTGRHVFIAELGLDGRLRPVRGILPAVMAAVPGRLPGRRRRAGQRGRGRTRAGRQGPGLRRRWPGWLSTSAPTRRTWPSTSNPSPRTSRRRRCRRRARAGAGHVRCLRPGRRRARALEVAAAGAHHLLLTGPPGAGKTMLAERLPGLLPDLGDTEAMEVTAIHSLCSLPSGVRAAAAPAALREPAPHRHRGGHHRRRIRAAAARGGVPGAPGSAVPGRGPRI